MLKLPKNRWIAVAAAVVTAIVLVSLYWIFGALSIFLFGSLLAVANAFLDEKLTHRRLFLTVCGAALAFGGAFVGNLETKQARAEAGKFQKAVGAATSDLSAKTDEVSRLAKQVLELSKGNSALSESLVQKSQLAADLSRSLAFPLQGALRADVAIEVSGRQPSVAAYAAQLHLTAFPDGKQRYGYLELRQLDSSDLAQAALTQFVDSLFLTFVLCPKSSCDFARPTFDLNNTYGVAMVATASLSPEIDPSSSLRQSGPLIVNLGPHVRVLYDANNNSFQIVLHSEPLQVKQLTNALPDSGRLPGQYIFLAGPIDVFAHGEIKSIGIARSDGRWLAIERLNFVERSGITYCFGRLKSQWM